MKLPPVGGKRRLRKIRPLSSAFWRTITYFHADGKSQSKAEYIAAVTGSGRYESFTDSATQICVYGKTAVLNGYVDVKSANQPSYRVHTLEVYVENNGQWQMAAHQSVRINNQNTRQ